VSFVRFVAEFTSADRAGAPPTFFQQPHERPARAPASCCDRTDRGVSQQPDVSGLEVGPIPVDLVVILHLGPKAARAVQLAKDRVERLEVPPAHHRDAAADQQRRADPLPGDGDR
jgi:hypothetical protein